jgi:hypothetical protein
VDDGVRGCSTGPQALEIPEAPAVDGDPSRSERGRRFIGPRQADDGMAGAPKLLDDG